MLTREEIEQRSARIAEFVRQNRISEAADVVRDNWLIFAHLPQHLRDSEELALAAMGCSLQGGNNASLRLKADMRFFLRAFNSCHFLNPIALTSARDLVFMLEYSKHYLNYRHEVSEDAVVSAFGLSGEAANQELDHGRDLVVFCRREQRWLTGDKTRDIEHMKTEHPGFAAASYEHAHIWAFGKRASALAAEYR